MNGLSNWEIIYEDNTDYPVIYDKQHQVHQLLLRNERFVKDIERLRAKYNVGKYEVESSKPSIIDNLDPKEPKKREQFYREIEKIAEKINFPGEWKQAVRDIAVGFVPEGSVFSFDNQKRIKARKNNDHIEVKIYGDVTVPELRKANKAIRDLIASQVFKTRTNNEARKKSRLSKNLLIYDLAKEGKSYNEIANYLDDKGIQNNMGYSNVSKYLELVQKQISEIYA